MNYRSSIVDNKSRFYYSVYGAVYVLNSVNDIWKIIYIGLIRVIF
jgi:hypothetical protein